MSAVKALQSTQSGLRQAASLMNRSVALTVTFRGMGNRRKISSADFEVQADKSLVTANKKLIDAPELDAIAKLDGEARRFIIDRCSLIIKDGIYLMPLGFVTEINDGLNDFNSRRKQLVETLIGVRDRIVGESRKRLRDLFDEDDYMTADDMREAFDIEWRIISWEPPSNLRSMVSKEIAEQEERKAQEEWGKLKEDMEQILAANLSDLIEHLKDRLTSEGGKKKVFRDSAVSKIKEFVATFDIRNTSGNEKLSKLAAQVGSLLEGVDAETLRESRRTRDNVRQGFEQITKEFDKFIVDKPKRAISFDD